MAIKREELVSGCIAAAADDEPVFVLRGQDMFAPELVRAWAEKFRSAHQEYNDLFCGMGDHAGTLTWKTAKAQAKYEEALQLANLMETWRTRKVPD